MDEDQKWHPYYLGNPVYAFLLMVFFEWGVAMHDLEVENIVKGKRKLEENKALHAGIMRKVKRQALKDYVLFPALTGPLFPMTLAGNAVANLVRNIWAFNIIFCGHFPAGVATFSQEECEDESRGHWYYRQLLGSANITGGKLFHVMTGNLSHQIEHHLFPDLPARRYPEIAGEVREICERYGLAYNTGSLRQAAVQRGPEDLPDGAAGPQAPHRRARYGRCDRARRWRPDGARGHTEAMSDHLSKAEIGKDAVQSTVEAAADTVGQVATIITKAVQDVAGAVGGFASEVYEIRDASARRPTSTSSAGQRRVCYRFRRGIGNQRTAELRSAEGHPERRLPERRELPGAAQPAERAVRRRSPTSRGTAAPSTSPAGSAVLLAAALGELGLPGAALERQPRRGPRDVGEPGARDRPAVDATPTTRCVVSGPRCDGLEREVAQPLRDRPQLAAAGHRGGGVDPDVGDASPGGRARRT